MKKIAGLLGISVVGLALAGVGLEWEAQAKVPAPVAVVSQSDADPIGVVGDELIGSCNVSEESCRKAWKALGQLVDKDHL